VEGERVSGFVGTGHFLGDGVVEYDVYRVT